MRKSRNIPLLNLDSLVDIVSNNVGILVILAVMVSLFSISKPTQTVTESQEKIEIIKKITIPWAHFSQKSALLFIVRDNRITYLDRSKVYQSFEKEMKKVVTGELDTRVDSYNVKLIPYSSLYHCLQFFPDPDSGFWWHQFNQNKGLLKTLISKFQPTEYYFFFWVDSSSFELFKDMRDTLHEMNYEVGWKPVTDQSILLFCNDGSSNLSYQPQ
ncbi:MAG: hypothetical protein HQM11_08680 [SAR324 cluster bacterium]|nr:hypothetical protein [SAR324 cluster bacterium]